MKNIIFKNRWIQIVFGSLLLVAGVLTFVFAILNNAQLTSAISIIVAVCCLILGIIYIASSFISEAKVLFPGSLFFGAFCIAVGVLLCIDTQLLGSIIVYLVGALALAIGVVCVCKAIVYILMKKNANEGQVKTRFIVMFFTIAAVLITLGILIFVFSTNASVVIYAVVGLAFAAYGIYNIVDGAKEMHKKEKEDDKVVATQSDTKELENKKVVVKDEIVDKTK